MTITLFNPLLLSKIFQMRKEAPSVVDSLEQRSDTVQIYKIVYKFINLHPRHQVLESRRMSEI